MRSSKICPKCAQRDILYLPRLTDFQRSSLAAFVSDSAWDEDGSLEVKGRIEAYVCRGCGYTELFTVSPGDIPVEKIKGARLLTGARTPYR